MRFFTTILTDLALILAFVGTGALAEENPQMTRLEFEDLESMPEFGDFIFSPLNNTQGECHRLDNLLQDSRCRPTSIEVRFQWTCYMWKEALDCTGENYGQFRGGEGEKGLVTTYKSLRCYWTPSKPQATLFGEEDDDWRCEKKD